MLAEHGNDVKVVQELMRHAKLSTTMEIYTHPRMEKKREAQSSEQGRGRAVRTPVFGGGGVRQGRPQDVVSFVPSLYPFQV
jgi:hypothetical protein